MNRALLLLSLSAALASALPAQAGFRQSEPVQFGADWARAGMGSVHNDDGGPAGSSSYSSVSCRKGVSSKVWYVFCEAHGGGRSLACISYDVARFKDVLRSMSGDSRVWFSVSPDGSCAVVEIGNGSQFEVKR